LKINLAADSCSYYTPSGSTSVQQPELLNLKLFPNPASNKAIVNIPYTESEHLSIRVFNIEGQQVKEYAHVHPPTFTFNVEELKNGIYLLQISDTEKVVGNIKFGVVK
jgi:hypothetical protein